MDVVGEKRALLHKATDPTALDAQVRRLEAQLCEGAVGFKARRENLRLKADLADARRELRRRHRKRYIFEELANDIETAADMARALEERSAAKRRRLNHAATIASEAESASAATAAATADVTLRDAILFDDGSGVVRPPESAPMDQRCINCDTEMERGTNSHLCCPKCGFQRWYADSTTTAGAAAGALSRRRTEGDGATPKAVLHFLCFLAATQGRTTKSFSKELLRKLCFYAYVEGARTPGQVTKDIVNRAQRYEGGSTQHTRSILYTVLLRGNAFRFPPEVLHKLVLLFRKMWPVFLVNKSLMRTDRRNTQAFKYLTRLFFKLLGLDVYLDSVEPFRMIETRLMHSSFARQLFHRLGWVWTENLCDEGISNAMLDRYDRAQALRDVTTGP